MSTTIFEAVVAIGEEYLGPAARRFMARQIVYHLEKQPEDLEAGDLSKLTEWTKVTMAMLTADKSVISAYTKQMNELEASLDGDRVNRRG